MATDQWGAWDSLEPGTQFVVRGMPQGDVFIKLRRDPFGAPIGRGGIVNLASGAEHVITELADMYDVPLFDQIEIRRTGGDTL